MEIPDSIPDLYFGFQIFQRWLIPGACGGEEGSSSFSNILINMDTRETSSYSGRRPGDSLNEVDSADLLDPTALSQNLNESLNISETQNMSDSLTNIANQAYNSHLNM